MGLAHNSIVIGQSWKSAFLLETTVETSCLETMILPDTGVDTVQVDTKLSAQRLMSGETRRFNFSSC